MEILGQRPVWSMSGSDMLSTLDATYAEIARLETLALHLIAGLDTTGHAHELGAGTTARLLTFRYRIDPTKARRDVHLATTLPKYPAVAAALPDPHSAEAANDDEHGADVDGAGVDGAGVDGAGVGVLLHPAQAEAIVSALDKVPATVPADDLRIAEQQLVELGRTHGPLDLRKAGRLVRDRLDTDGPEPAEQKAYDRETLTLKNAANGVAFTGYLANDNAELFRTLIHTHAKPHKTIDGAPDPRPRTKRQADALTTLLTTTNPTTGTATTTTAATTRATAPADTATAASASASTGASEPTDTAATTDSAGSAGNRQGPGFTPGHGPKPHITVTIDYNDLKAATADKLGHLIYGDALSAATIRRLACDAHILPIVLGSDSQPLDVGTTVRLATGPIRKALITRDKGCVCCGAPPIYCDAHHVKSWIDGGATKITNLVLLCKRCHRDLHAGHWTIHITNGIVEVDRPAWATPNPIPRDRYRPPTTTPHPPPATPTTSTTTGHPPTTDATTGRASTTGGAAGGPVTRAWPRDTDPPWITAEDTARLNPWGETTDERSVRPQKPPPPGGDFAPWGDTAAQRPPHTHMRKQQDHQEPSPEASPPRPSSPPEPPLLSADGFDPWGEGPDSRHRSVPSKPARPAQTGTGLDIWGDTADPNPAVDRRSQLGTEVVLPLDQRRTNATRTFDPWNDLAPESADEHNPADDDPKPSPHSADPLADTTNPHKASTTAA
ncbi:HNH endonuclease [Kribbella sp. NBC_01484]|uniref:HNH endonuclease signature motif containing protein n=1 Tax=Kribbella sp. NBC_01484 TaxID=2903579 RepID=UPI002E2FCF28|nr:DUF222 domain-containing protein [Kribbella sp. NBC_01484]